MLSSRLIKIFFFFLEKKSPSPLPPAFNSYPFKLSEMHFVAFCTQLHDLQWSKHWQPGHSQCQYWTIHSGTLNIEPSSANHLIIYTRTFRRPHEKYGIKCDCQHTMLQVTWALCHLMLSRHQPMLSRHPLLGIVLHCHDVKKVRETYDKAITEQ